MDFFHYFDTHLWLEHTLIMLILMHVLMCVAICSRSKSEFREVGKSKSWRWAQKRCKSSWQWWFCWILDCGGNIFWTPQNKYIIQANLIHKGLKFPCKENPEICSCIYILHVQLSGILWSVNYFLSFGIESFLDFLIFLTNFWGIFNNIKMIMFF